MRHAGAIRTEWFEGPFTQDEADELVAAITRAVPPGEHPAAGDRGEGAFSTRHYGVLTVGYRGCLRYREAVRRFDDGTADTVWSRQVRAARIERESWSRI